MIQQYVHLHDWYSCFSEFQLLYQCSVTNLSISSMQSLPQQRYELFWEQMRRLPEWQSPFPIYYSSYLYFSILITATQKIKNEPTDNRTQRFRSAPSPVFAALTVPSFCDGTSFWPAWPFAELPAPELFAPELPGSGVFSGSFTGSSVDGPGFSGSSVFSF